MLLLRISTTIHLSLTMMSMNLASRKIVRSAIKSLKLKLLIKMLRKMVKSHMNWLDLMISPSMTKESFFQQKYLTEKPLTVMNSKLLPGILPKLIPDQVRLQSPFQFWMKMTIDQLSIAIRPTISFLQD